MKVKLFQVCTAYTALAGIANNPFEPLMAYRIQKNIRALEPEYLAYEKARTALVKKHGDRTVNENKQEQWTVLPNTKKWGVFQKELEPLLSEEVEINIVKIQISAFKQMTPSAISALEFMLEGLDDETSAPDSNTPSRKRAGKGTKK